MKESLNKLHESLEINVNPRTYSPLGLAFIGDSVFDIIIRTKVMLKANVQVNKLHIMCRNYVKASGQADFYRAIEEMLTEEEMGAFKRGRNAKSNSVPKNAKLIDYKMATGVEALLGYLFLKGEIDRIMEIVEFGLRKLDGDE